VAYDFLHVAVDDCSRMAYLEIHPDERSQAAVGFTGRALAWFAGLGVAVAQVMTDNGACYRPSAFRQLLGTAGITHQRTRPYRPCTNGKVERFNQTLDREWAYAAAYTSNQARLDGSPAGSTPTTTTVPTPPSAAGARSTSSTTSLGTTAKGLVAEYYGGWPRPPATAFLQPFAGPRGWDQVRARAAR
jgi:transposase InsO family protein